MLLTLSIVEYRYARYTRKLSELDGWVHSIPLARENRHGRNGFAALQVRDPVGWLIASQRNAQELVGRDVHGAHALIVWQRLGLLCVVLGMCVEDDSHSNVTHLRTRHYRVGR